MQLTQNLAQEIRSYIKNLLSKEVIVVDADGVCISSPNQDDVGVNIELPRDTFTTATLRTLERDGSEQLIIPLKYEAEHVAALLVNDNAPDMKQYVPLIKSFAELLMQQYLVVHRPVLDSTDQFVTKLLNHATPADLPFYESEARVLGYDFRAKRLAIVIHLKNFWERCLDSLDQPSYEREDIIKHWKGTIDKNLSGFFTKNTDSMIAYIGNDRFVVYKAVQNQEEEDNTVKLLKKSHKAIFEPLKNFHITDVVVGFGNSYSGSQGLIDAFREANLALEFGGRLWGDNKSYYFGDLGILSILGEGNREKEITFANQLLKRLTNEDLIKTLECFFEENLNLTETADRMGIHRNTVIYRLNQISNTLSVDPRIFEQAMTIKIALLIKKLFG